MDLMDWFKPRLSTDWITGRTLEQISSACGEFVYTVHFLHSWVHPSFQLIVMSDGLEVILYALLFLNRREIWQQSCLISLFMLALLKWTILVTVQWPNEKPYTASAPAENLYFQFALEMCNESTMRESLDFSTYSSQDSIMRLFIVLMHANGPAAN